MAAERPWSVDDYRSTHGSRPVKEFLGGLSKAARPKAYAMLGMLERYGNQLRMPHSRSLGEGLHELRVTHPEGPSGSCTFSGRDVGSCCYMPS